MLPGDKARRKARPKRRPAPAEERLGDLAYEAVRREILLGHLPSRQHVSEAQLRRRLGTSQAAMRSALIRLAQDGLVQPIARRGYVIAPITMRDVQEIFELRLLLEPYAARMAAGAKNDAERLIALDEHVKVQYARPDRASELEYLRANRAFHVAIAESAGNTRLANIVGRLLDDLERILNAGAARRDRAAAFQHEHQNLLRAILSGDAATAERLARDAIAGGQQMTLDAILANPETVGVGRSGRTTVDGRQLRRQSAVTRTAARKPQVRKARGRRA